MSTARQTTLHPRSLEICNHSTFYALSRSRITFSRMVSAFTSQAHTRDELIAELQAEIKELARERRAVILAHNYERPEVQDVADFVGDSLGLSREAAKTSEIGRAHV